MARPLRVEYPGALYHVTSRGNRREDIFNDDEDRLVWLEVFSQVCKRFNWRCHSWCLMDNHYHILVETAEANLSNGMRQLNGVYTQRSNRKHDRIGHVFQGRYKAILVQKDEHLLELCRYVILNPLRAGMVTDPQKWTWSSYGIMIGELEAPAWMETNWLLSWFSKHRKKAIIKYINFVREGVGLPSVWEALRSQIYFGSKEFIKNALLQSDALQKDDLIEINRLQRRPLPPSLQWYKENSNNRNEAMALAYATGDYTMKKIAEWFDVHYSTVSRAVKKFEENG